MCVWGNILFTRRFAKKKEIHKNICEYVFGWGFVQHMLVIHLESTLWDLEASCWGAETMSHDWGDQSHWMSSKLQVANIQSNSFSEQFHSALKVQRHIGIEPQWQKVFWGKLTVTPPCYRLSTVLRSGWCEGGQEMCWLNICPPTTRAMRYGASRFLKLPYLSSTPEGRQFWEHHLESPLWFPGCCWHWEVQCWFPYTNKVDHGFCR